MNDKLLLRIIEVTQPTSSPYTDPSNGMLYTPRAALRAVIMIEYNHTVTEANKIGGKP